MLTINVVTIFPDFFAGPLGVSIPARAKAAGGVEYRLIDLRDYTHDRHRTVDDAPYGGGPGMVMKPQPFFEAVEAIGAKSPIVLLSPRGRTFSQADARRYAEGTELTLLCGHYKDVDQRVADHLATEELSIGDFVLSGGEAAALAVIDATVRLIPGDGFRCFTLVDDFTHECLAIDVGHSLPGLRVIQVLERLAATGGLPRSIVCDNGPEFAGRALDVWAHQRGVALQFIRPGKPVENAFIESFNGKFRDECLSVHWFSDLRDAQRLIEAWRHDFNTLRPHRGLSLRTPDEFTRQLQDQPQPQRKLSA